MRRQQRGDILVLLVVGTILVGILGGLGYKFWSSAERAGRLACEHEREVADQMLVVAAEEAVKNAANKIIDMEAAYEAGLEESKKKQVVYVTKGASDVAKYPVFSNPVCVLPDDSLRNLNSSRTGASVRAATDQPEAPAAVRPTPPTIRWPGRDAVPADAGRR